MEKIQTSPPLGQPLTMQVIDGKIVMHGHELTPPHRKWVTVLSDRMELLECHPVDAEVQ